jgi:hypothetical protein
MAFNPSETGIAIAEVAETVMGQHAALNKERFWFLGKLEAIYKWVGSSHLLSSQYLCKRQRRLYEFVDTLQLLYQPLIQTMNPLRHLAKLVVRHRFSNHLHP